MSQRTDELLGLAQRAVKLARERGAAEARTTCWQGTESGFEWRDGKVDRVRESTRLSLSVVIHVDGRYSANSTSDLRPEALDKFVTEAVAMTRVLAPDPHRALPEPARYTDRFAGDLKLLDPQLESLPTDFRKKTAAALEQAARSVPGADKIVSVTTSCTTFRNYRAKASSNGMAGTDESTLYRFGASTSVSDAEGRKPSASWGTQSRHMAALEPVERVGRTASERALSRIGARPRATGTYACVVENVAASQLIDALLVALDGGNIQQKNSFLAEQLDKPIASAALSITDEPHLPEGFGSCTFDGEGMSTRRRLLVERGVLRTFLLDTYYARKLQREPTIQSSTNLTYATGTRSPQALLADMKTGILITGFIGGNSNPATGDFSFGIQGQWIEGGKPVQPLAEMNLSGNHLSFWKKLLETGNDPYLFHANRRPSLRFDKVQFSGTKP
jgi:PmbA protein